MKIMILAQVVEIYETKNRKEELPRNENTTHLVHHSNLQVLLEKPLCLLCSKVLASDPEN